MLHLQGAISFGQKARRLSDGVIPRGEPNPRDGREDTMMGRGISTRTGMVAGVRAGTKMERRVERRENPET